MQNVITQQVKSLLNVLFSREHISWRLSSLSLAFYVLDAQARRQSTPVLFLHRGQWEGSGGKNQGSQVVRSGFAPDREPGQGPIPVSCLERWEEAAFQAALNPPEPCLWNQGSRVNQSLRSSPSQANLSSHGRRLPSCEQLASPGHGGNKETPWERRGHN